MSISTEVAKALGKKHRAVAFTKVIDAALESAESAPTWEDLHLAMEEGWCGIVEFLLTLPLIQDKPDPALAQVRLLIEEYDDLKYYAFRAAHNAVNHMPTTPAAGEKRKRDTEASMVITNTITLLHGVKVHTEKKASFKIRLESLNGWQERARSQLSENSSGLTARQRNKKGKEGVLQVFTASCHQRVFSDLWLGIFGDSRLERRELLILLETLHESIMPFLSSPLALFDFLSDAYHHGGYEGILSLNSLFILMVDHGLEYPAFFDKLYELFTPDVCCMAHRGVFFELIGKFLRSFTLSAAIVASFVKKACRLALHAPSPAVFFLISLVKLLLIRHPQVMPLIHRKFEQMDFDEEEKEEAAVWEGRDPYNFDEKDPSKTGAVDSSCWELRALLVHYNPTISATTKELCEELKQPLGGAEPLLTSRAGRTYTRMVQREILREIKGVPTAAYADPKPFHPEEDSKNDLKTVGILSSVFSL